MWNLSFLTRDHNHVPCIARQILNHQTTTEVPNNCNYCVCTCAQLLQSCPTLCSSMDCSPPCSLGCGILQARILECVAVPCSRGSSQPRDWTQVSYIGGGQGGFFTTSTTWEALLIINHLQIWVSASFHLRFSHFLYIRKFQGLPFLLRGCLLFLV